MRLKYYLRGLGLGIIFAVIIVKICSHDNSSDIVLDSETQTLESVYNTDSEEQSEIDSEAEETNTDNLLSDESVQNTEMAESETASSEEQQEGIQSPEEVNQNEVIDYNTASTTTTGTVIITVSDGEACRGVAEELQARGLIADAEDFRIYMGNKGYASFIHNGEFEIPVGSTYEQIAKILLGK